MNISRPEKKTKNHIPFCTIAIILACHLAPVTAVFDAIHPVCATSSVAADISWFNPEKKKKTYSLYTEAQLRGLAQLVNTSKISWEPYSDFTGITIRLKKDIKLSGNWTPIGNSDMYFFNGTFDGNGHTISGLSIQKAITSNIGLFGYVTGEIKNLNIKGKIHTEADDAGGIAGHITSRALIENCRSSVVVVSTGKRAGGVVGSSQGGFISSCHNFEKITGSAKVGGIVGENWGGKIEKSGNEGDILSTGRGVGTFGTGGVAGRSVAATAMIDSCFNRGVVSGKNECIGGIAGFASAGGSTVVNSYNAGAVSGAGAKSYAGGILGSVAEDGIKIINCYNVGTVKNAQSIGGILGNYSAKYYEKIHNSISNNYYLQDSAKLAVGKEKEAKGLTSYSKTAEPKTSLELHSPRMIPALGPEFEVDPYGPARQNEGYPILRWEQKRPKKDESSKEETMTPEVVIQEFLEKQPYRIFSNARAYYEELLTVETIEEGNKYIM